MFLQSGNMDKNRCTHTANNDAHIIAQRAAPIKFEQFDITESNKSVFTDYK